jgi:REP element-mobilizing transposase RayT
MSLHSYSRIWLHLTWATLERRPLLPPRAAAAVSGFLREYAAEKQVYMRLNYVNRDHVHAVIDLPTSLTVEETLQLFKGASSHWLNKQNLIPGKFAWGRGYGVFSVSHSGLNQVCKYVANQGEHHHKRTFAEELQMLVERHGLKWHADETVETVSDASPRRDTPR